MTAADAWAFLISDAGQRLFQNVIAVTALIFAIRGVRNWNHERRDLRRAELAEKTLAVSYRAKDAIGMVRSPLGSMGEGETRRHGEGETPEQSRALDIAFAPIERLNRVADIFEEIQTLRYNITAAFGPNAADPLNVFLQVRAEIIAASYSRMRDADPMRRLKPMDDKAIARMEKLDAVIWEGYADEERIVPRLDAAIADLERTFRPFVEASFRSFATRFLTRRQP